jgi:hypothetical protein
MQDDPRLVSFLYAIGSTHADPPPSPIATTGSGPYRSRPARWRLNLVDSPHLEPLVQRYQAKQHRFHRASAVRQYLGKAAVDAGRTLRNGSPLTTTQLDELLDACRALADYMDA